MKEHSKIKKKAIITGKNKTDFLVDGMLGTLATKLRILGFDTLYDKVSSDSELLNIARDTERFLVTSDIDLFVQSRRLGVKSILISARDDSDALVEIYSKLGLMTIAPRRLPRCSACNGPLVKSGALTREGKDIYTCAICLKKYWKGGHWRMLDAIFKDANSKLHEKLNSNKIAVKKECKKSALKEYS